MQALLYLVVFFRMKNSFTVREAVVVGLFNNPRGAVRS